MRGRIGGGQRNGFGKSCRQDGVGSESDKREKFRHDTPLVRLDLHFAVRITWLYG
jgi:hypothetical protein